MQEVKNMLTAPRKINSTLVAILCAYVKRFVSFLPDKENKQTNKQIHKLFALQSGSVCLNLNFRRIFVESIKTIHFWKAYGIGNQKNNVSICPESNMSAILHFTKWPP